MYRVYITFGSVDLMGYRFMDDRYRITLNINRSEKILDRRNIRVNLEARGSEREARPNHGQF